MLYATSKYGRRPITPAFGQYSHEDRVADKKAMKAKAKFSKAQSTSRCDGCRRVMEVMQTGKEMFDITEPHWVFDLYVLCDSCATLVESGDQTQTGIKKD